ncbi:MAG: hypothetical protein ACYC4R_05375 [Anaerolineae bacterium]
MTTQLHALGARPVVYVTFTTAAGEAIDPETVTFAYRKPSDTTYATP